MRATTTPIYPRPVSSPLATSLSLLAALLDGWATQPELAARIWEEPDEAGRRAVARHLAALKRAGVPLEERPREGHVTRPATEFRVTMAGIRRMLKGRGSTG